MKSILVILFIFSTQIHAKSAFTPEFEPYMSGTHGSFKFDGDYKGSFTAAGAGIKIGASLGPIYVAGEAQGQIPVFIASGDPEDTSTDVSPMPNTDLWMSYGLAIGMKTRFLSLIYTYIFDTTLNANIRNDRGIGLSDENYEYTYHGNGHKLGVMVHLTKNFSIGAEASSYKFSKYTLDKDTHVVTSGSKETRDNLELAGLSLLLNYNITLELK